MLNIGNSKVKMVAVNKCANLLDQVTGGGQVLDLKQQISDLYKAIQDIPNNHIIIEVDGGIVTTVYSNDKDLPVEVIDWDDEKQEEDEELKEYNKKLYQKAKTMKVVY